MKDNEKKTEKRYEVFEVGFRRGTYATHEEAKKACRGCYEYSYYIDRETGEQYHYGGPVSG